jgi:NADPH-dependent 2,4-dienoyl-CoA reductase/sulfur reductase-like enzyme
MAARTLGKRVTVVARSDQILSRNIGATDAAIVQGWLEEAGIRFLLGRQTTAVEHAGGRRCLTTVEGDAVPAELLVAAKGAAPNIAWAAPVGARTDQGLAVDGGMRTGIPNVFAAGDAALARHAVTGRVEACATWPSACAQGAVAGANMAGGDAWLAGEIPFNVLPIFDRRVSFMGCTSREALGCLGEGVEHTVVGRPAAGRGRTLWFHDGRVVGAVVFGSQPDAGRLRQAILSGGRVASRHGEVKQLPSLPAAHRRGRSHRR